MQIRMNVAIDFYEQEKASVYLESFSLPSDEEVAEIMLLVMFAIRQMSNLGVNETTDQMAGMFMGLPAAIRGLASGEVTGGLQLILPPGQPGRKRFDAKLTMTPQQTNLALNAKGFGWFATGMNYYAPVSVLALVRYLAMKRSNDEYYLTILAKAVAKTGGVHLDRQITLSNHAAIAASIVASTCDPKIM